MSIIDDLLETGERHVRKVLLERRDPALQGFYHLVAPDPSRGKDRIILTNWQNDIQKQLQVAAVRDLSREIGAIAALLIHEAWMLVLPEHLTQGQMDRLPRPSESPDRIEVVQMAATDGRTTMCRTLRMLRDKPGGRLIGLEPLSEAGDNPAYRGLLIDDLIEVTDG